MTLNVEKVKNGYIVKIGVDTVVTLSTSYVFTSLTESLECVGQQIRKEFGSDAAT